MDIKRIIKHLSVSHASMHRTFSRVALGNIERTISEVEQTHAGQIRFAVEAALDIKPLFAGLTARERAIEVFSQLRVWDTEHNNGVLIYLLLADRDVEIVADRGIHIKLGPAVWEEVCLEMETAFRQGKFEEGVIAGIRRVGAHLAQHFPLSGLNKINELPDSPVLM
jgi:uncharacterized membrane protein